MTTLMVVDGDRGESRTKAIARRLRTELADRNINVTEVARRLGVAQQNLSRRMTGTTDWRIGELDAFCAAAGISFAYVTTGVRPIPSSDGPDDGGVRPKGFEPLTFCDITDDGDEGQVIEVDFGPSEDSDGDEDKVA